MGVIFVILSKIPCIIIYCACKVGPLAGLHYKICKLDVISEWSNIFPKFQNSIDDNIKAYIISKNQLSITTDSAVMYLPKPRWISVLPVSSA